MSILDYGVSFNGRRIVHPGAYDYIDASSMVVASGGSMNLPIVVGCAESGEPGVLKWFSDAEVARKYLTSGELMTAVDLMMSPSPAGGGGATIVGVMVANSNTAATLTKGGLSLKSLEHSIYSNRIQAGLEDGTLPNTKKLTFSRWDTSTIEVYDNLGALFSIKYTGAAAYAELTVTVDGTTKKTTRLQTKVGADAATAVLDLDLDLTNTDTFDTMDSVIRYIASVSDYQVDYVSYWNSGIAITSMDACAAVPLKSTAAYVHGLTADVIYQVNSLSSLASVEVTGALTNFDATNLAGGTTGTAASSWVDYFDKIKKSYSDVLVVLTANTAIQAEAITHVQQMEKRNQRQMLFTGGDVGENINQVKQRAMLLNSSRAVVAYPGIYVSAVSKGKKALPSYLTAAMIAGRVCGVSATEPITFDYFNAVALEQDLLAGDPEIDDLITSGVCTLERTENGGIRLVQGITTYLGGNNTLYREISVRRGADSLSDKMRRTLENKFVGSKGTSATPGAVQTAAIDVLKQAVRDGDIVAYRNVTVTFTDTIVRVDYEVAPVEPINFVLVTSRFVPYSQF